MPTIATLLSLLRRLNPWRVRALENAHQKLRAEHDRLRSEGAALLRQNADLARENTLLERYRAATAEVVVSAPHLEINLDRFNPSQASETIYRYGCLIVRGNERSRDAVVAYRRFLDGIGYTKWPAPTGGGLWQMQRTPHFWSNLKEATGADPGFRPEGDNLVFPIHQLVRELFAGLFERHFGAKIMMSSTCDTATVRTVSPATDVGLVKFHQDISPVDLPQCLTFWVLVDADGAGRRSPGLRFVVSNGARSAARMAHKTDETGYHEVDDLRLSIDQFYWAPEINVGDIVIFDPYAPHASYSHTGMTENRTSVDLRVAPFDPGRANSFLAAGHGLILFNRERMFGPTRLVSAPPPTFEYGLLGEADDEPDRSLSSAFELAKSTPFGAAPTLQN